jgi:hypothetical protein
VPEGIGKFKYSPHRVSDEIYKVHRLDGLRRHDMYTKSHYHHFRNSGNMKGATSESPEVMVLLFLTGGIHYVHHSDDIRLHDIYV